MNLETNTKVAAKLVHELTRLGSNGWDMANHHAYMFLMDIAANNQISQESLTSYSNDYHEQVDNVDNWLNKDFEAMVRTFSEKLREYRENPTEETALELLK